MTISQFFSLRGVRIFCVLLLANVAWMCADAAEYTAGVDSHGFDWYQFDPTLADFPNERIVIIMATPGELLQVWLALGQPKPPAGTVLGGFALPNHEKCQIYLSVPNPTDVPTADVIAHELRHCRGWAHKPVTQ